MTGALIPGIGQAIQFAVAPALLLVGIGNLLNVVAVRLARIVDRARALERGLGREEEAQARADRAELRVLGRRMKVCHASVGFITGSGLCICLTIILLFVNGMRGMDYAQSVSVLFIAGMATLGLGLILFLWEITVALRVVKVGGALD